MTLSNTFSGDLEENFNSLNFKLNLLSIRATLSWMCGRNRCISPQVSSPSLWSSASLLLWSLPSVCSQSGSLLPLVPAMALAYMITNKRTTFLSSKTWYTESHVHSIYSFPFSQFYKVLFLFNWNHLDCFIIGSYHLFKKEYILKLNLWAEVHLDRDIASELNETKDSSSAKGLSCSTRNIAVCRNL